MNNFVHLDFSDDQNLVLSDMCSLRRLVGILGMALPELLYVGLQIASEQSLPLASISHYYYTRVGSILVIVVSLLAIFLIVYKGKEPVDFWLSLVAGVFALALLLFPTSNISDVCCDPIKTYSVTKLPVSPFRENFHYISAGIFLGCLAGMSLFLFTKTNKPRGSEGNAKRARNRIYMGCGLLMILAILVILLDFLSTTFHVTILIPHDWYEANHLTFWAETVAVESFGFSWLIKGETFFRDQPTITPVE